MEEAITNSTILIFLAKIRKLWLLNVYKIFTTPKVIEEVTEGKNISDMEKKDLQEFIEKRIQIESPEKIILNKGIGESSAISLCVEKKIKIFLSDDKQARKTAELLSLLPVGSLGIIIKNLEMKIISKEEAKKYLDLLIINSYYISIDLYRRVLDSIEKFN
ncbi:DUF3368 domain-containing protein [Candidatus Woesearchaeota archaeon]|nr:DUF3368 domain-containing protein [Candidatus Woesearchaeota archaeon]